MVQFSSSELAQLQQILALLHDPLDGPGFDAWRQEVNARLQALLGADRVNFTVPFDAPTPSVLTGIDPSAAEQYFAYYAAIDPGPATRRALRLAVCSQRMIYPEDLPETELFNDFFLPHGLQGGILMNADLPDGTFAFLGVNRAGADEEFERRCLALLNLLLPGFEAGMRAKWRLGRERSSLGRLIDRLADGAALFGPRGRHLLHVNAALSEILAHDAEGERIRAEVERAARALGATPRAGERASGESLDVDGVQHVRTMTGTYAIHASAVGAEVTPEDRSIVVVVERRGMTLPSPEDLAARYALTPRESEVAVLLARGYTDRRIADELVISWHTARRHSERVLRKLSVGSRAEVGARLLDG